MLVLTPWLRELVDLGDHPEATDEEIGKRLTFAGLELDGSRRLDAGLEGVVVGEILSAEKVPETRLSICRVSDGTQELQIVCGAQNFAVGDKVPLAQVGAELPNGMKIAQAKVRGIPSSGMLCSPQELGLESEVDGLLILNPSAQAGTPIAEELGRKGQLLELDLTPNRADALSHFGVAREVAALFNAPLKPPTPQLPPAAPADELPALSIEASELCSHYAGRVIEGVKVGPSPLWLSQRLEAIGQRSLNNVVDATNYVLHELGQPLHAFDLDLLAGPQVTVRQARSGEKLKTLDDVERELSVDDLVIADSEQPIALAGVMGGDESAVNEQTTRVFLESAHFSPQSVRKSARRHGLHTDASHRFERGVDPQAVRLALDRLSEVILQVAGGELKGPVVEAGGPPASPRTVTLQRTKLQRLLGVEIPWDQSLNYLERLQLVVEAHNDEQATLRIPSFRQDLSLPEDLIEEIARLHGYGQITPRPLSSEGTSALQPASFDQHQALRSALSGAGFDEALNFAFISKLEAQRIEPEWEPIELKNPLGAELAVMRPSLLPGLLKNAAHNLRHGVDTLRLYELGRCYLPLDSAPTAPLGSPEHVAASEPSRLGLLAWGRRDRPGWLSKDEPYDFYDLKGCIEELLQALRIEGAHFERSNKSHLHPRSATHLKLGEQSLGHFGELHPGLLKSLDLPKGVLLGELELDALLAAASSTPSYTPIPRFPASLRDLAVVVGEGLQVERVREEILKVDSEGLINEVTLFDVYQGAPLPADRKSLAWSISYRSAQRTLKDEEVNQLHERIVGHLREALGAELR